MKLLIFLLLAFFCSSKQLKFEVPPGQEHCFYNEYQKNQEIEGSYLVTQGGNLDIEAKILGPDSHVLAIQFEKNQKGRFLAIHAMAEKNGIHQVCFSNKMSRWAKKRVTFQSAELRSERSKQTEELLEEKDVSDLLDKLGELRGVCDQLQVQVELGGIEHSLQIEFQETQSQRMDYITKLEIFMTLAITVYQVRTIRGWFAKHGNKTRV